MLMQMSQKVPNTNASENQFSHVAAAAFVSSGYFRSEPDRPQTCLKSVYAFPESHCCFLLLLQNWSACSQNWISRSLEDWCLATQSIANAGTRREIQWKAFEALLRPSVASTIQIRLHGSSSSQRSTRSNTCHPMFGSIYVKPLF